MRLSPNGLAACGVGDGVVSVDGTPVPGAPISGEPAWLERDLLGYRSRGGDGVYRLARWRVGDATTAALDDQSATWFRAGSGVWAAFLAGSGVRTSTGLRYPAAGLGDVSDEGELVICPDYQVGQNLRVLNNTGGVLSEVATGPLGTDATAGPNVRLRGDVLLYQAGGAWHAYVLGVGPVTLATRAVAINYAVPIVVPGRAGFYLLEREAARLTLRKFDSLDGWIIATGDNLWAPDAISQNGDIVIGWATNAAETPGSAVTVRQSLSAPAMPLDPVPVDPRVPPTSPIVTFPGYQPPAQASYGRKGYCGPYFATDLRTGNFSTPGNTEMIVNGTVLAGNQQVTRPVFVSLQCTGNDPAKMAGFLAGANDDSLGNAGISACYQWTMRAKPIVRYYDGTPMPADFIAGCERDAIVQVQCYPRSGESVSTSMARFVESVDRVIASGRKCGITRGFNTKYGGLRTVLDIQDPLCAMVRNRPAIILDAWFSHGRWYTGVESGAAYAAELLAWEPILGGLFTGLP